MNRAVTCGVGRVSCALMAVWLFACLRVRAAEGLSDVGFPDRSNVFADSPELLEIQHRARDGEIRSYTGVVVSVSDDQSTILTSALDRRGIVRVAHGETTLAVEVVRVDPDRNLSLLKAPRCVPSIFADSCRGSAALSGGSGIN